ncbi:MAG: SufE family protein [Bacteroidota bacterium]
MLSIIAIQELLIQEFAALDNDRELLVDYLIDLGEKTEVLSPSEKVDAHLVPGCLAKVWLVQEAEKGILWLRTDSNASITKGLASLLVRIFSGQPCAEVVHANLFFISAIGLNQFIGIQRSSGLDYMIKSIKAYAKKTCARKINFS